MEQEVGSHGSPLSNEHDLKECKHCGLPNPDPRDSVFCCRGCEFVWNLLHKSGLEKYYDLKDQTPGFADSIRVTPSGNDFLFLDSDAKGFLEKGRKEFIEFYVEGVHCLACIWLFDKLPLLTDQIEKSEFDLQHSKLKIKLSENGLPSRVAALLDSLGYKPHALENETELQKHLHKEERRFLIRLGVSGAVAGNTMLLAVSLYAGAKDSWGEVFRVLSFFLSLPVISWCAWPFYRDALYSLLNFSKQKRLSIDLPVSVAILVGFSMSTLNLIRGNEDIYFDSLSVLIFLLLSSRYLVKRLQQRALSSERFLGTTLPTEALKFEVSEFKKTSIDRINLGDLLMVRKGDVTPVDGVILKGSAFANLSSLTGESKPIELKAGDKIYAGSPIVSGEVKVEVQNKGESTRIGQVLLKIKTRSFQRTPMITLLDRISGIFTAAVLLGITATFLYFYKDGFSIALNRALALAIVSCPCALGLSGPLVYSRILSEALKRGIFIKDATSLEIIPKIKNVFFDKTGTLTKGDFDLRDIKLISNTSKNEIFKILYAMEIRSEHPIAKAIVRYLIKSGLDTNGLDDFSISSWREIPGFGLQANVDGNVWTVAKPSEKTVFDISNAENQILSFVQVEKSGSTVALISLGDQIREESGTILRNLRRFGVEFFLLSGDAYGATQGVAKELEIKEENVFSGLSPEDKITVVENSGNGMFVGDGLNDAIALQKSRIGVAVSGSLEESLRVSDVYLMGQNINGIWELFSLAGFSNRLMKRNLLFSLIYNCFGAGFAISGLISPLTAAVVMPLSAITVFVSTFSGSLSEGRE